MSRHISIPADDYALETHYQARCEFWLKTMNQEYANGGELYQKALRMFPAYVDIVRGMAKLRKEAENE